MSGSDDRKKCNDTSAEVKPKGTGNQSKRKAKLRVAAYCRVSTDSDEQATSYEAQIEHYTLFIQNNPEWMLAGIFADM